MIYAPPSQIYKCLETLTLSNNEFVRDTISESLSDFLLKSQIPVEALWSLRNIDPRVIALHPFFVKLRMPQTLRSSNWPASQSELTSFPLWFTRGGIRSIPNKNAVVFLGFLIVSSFSLRAARGMFEASLPLFLFTIKLTDSSLHRANSQIQDEGSSSVERTYLLSGNCQG